MAALPRGGPRGCGPRPACGSPSCSEAPFTPSQAILSASPARCKEHLPWMIAEPCSGTITLRLRSARSGPHAGPSFQPAGHSACLVGRGPDGPQLALPGDQGLSRAHFLVDYAPPRAHLADLNSKNGTFVNGQRAAQTDLNDGDTVRAGF